MIIVIAEQNSMLYRICLDYETWKALSKPTPNDSVPVEKRIEEIISDWVKEHKR